MLRCCGASGCRSAGGEALRLALQQARDRLGGEAAAVASEPVGCLRLCGRGPLVAVDPPEPSGAVPALALAASPAAGELRGPVALAAGLGTGPGHRSGQWRSGRPASRSEPALLCAAAPVVLENCGVIDPTSDRRRPGPWRLRPAAAGARRSSAPEQVREQVKRSGLRGTRWRWLSHRPEVGHGGPAAARPAVSWSATPMRATRAPSWTAACWRATPTG